MTSDSSDSPLVLTPESTGTNGLTLEASSISTPESPIASTSVATSVKKARRQTAFYPNMNSSNKPVKPFSRSAAKRESVMALGSIEHLQHYFTKTGLAAKKNPLDKPHHGLVPAIGGFGHIPTSPSLDEIADLQMPPSPELPSAPLPVFTPHVKAHEVDPECLLPGVIDDVTTVAHAWSLERYMDDSSAPSINLNIPFDVLDVLKTTTRAIRSTRNYLLSLPDESAGSIRAQFRPKTLALSSMKSSSSTSLHALYNNSTNSTSTPPPADPIILIRRSALDVLTVLRELEERCRLPLSDDAYDAQSDGGLSRGATASSPSNNFLDLPHDDHRRTPNDPDITSTDIDPDSSITFSLVQVHGRYESVPVWEDEEDPFRVDADEENEKREKWDERLVLGSGWLYKQDFKLVDLQSERKVVGKYLDIVDEVLFDGKKMPGEERGWDKVRRKREGRASSRAAKKRASSIDRESKNLGLSFSDGNHSKRRVSTSMIGVMQGLNLSDEPEDMDDIKEEDEEEEVDDDELPAWAKRSTFVDDNLGRAHALLQYFLPEDLLPSLGPSSSRSAFLASLSSGQLLCVAYNSCVRRSKKPWGFVSKDGIHDIFALEAAAAAQKAKDADNNEKEKEGKKLWTFRRTDNLRLWAGALKLRYLLAIQLPSQSFAKAPQAPHPASKNAISVSATSTPHSSPSSVRFPRIGGDRESPIFFDARIVAKKEDGWEAMLEGVLYQWIEKAVLERRVSQ